MLDGRGGRLQFGGRVMKNVAGYDVSRLMAGSLGTLGLMLEISLKVLPRPAHEISLRFEMDEARAIETMNSWAQRPLPLSATCHADGVLTVRLSGTGSGVGAARTMLGGELLADDLSFWTSVREQTAPFFAGRAPLWRASVPSVARPLPLACAQLVEWGGALRWFATDMAAQDVRRIVAEAGGQAVRFRSPDRTQVFHPLSPALLEVHRRLKKAFDPCGILNPARMYDF